MLAVYKLDGLARETRLILIAVTDLEKLGAGWRPQRPYRARRYVGVQANLPGPSDFKIRSTESIVFQLRVVAGTPKSLSI